MDRVVCLPLVGFPSAFLVLIVHLWLGVRTLLLGLLLIGAWNHSAVMKQDFGLS